MFTFGWTMFICNRQYRIKTDIDMIFDNAILSSEQEIPMDDLGLAVAAPAASRGQLCQADGCGTGQEVAQGLVPGAAGGRLASMKHIGLLPCVCVDRDSGFMTRPGLETGFPGTWCRRGRWTSPPT